MVKYIPEELGATKVTRRNFTGDGSTTTFTVTNGLTVNKVIVDVNGIIQLPTTNYTISGSTLTFDSAPASGYTIHVIELPV